MAANQPDDLRGDWPADVARAADRRIALTERLLAITPLPLDVHSHGAHDDWTIVGPALMARAFGTLQSIAALLPTGRESDANALARILLEHVTTMAWLAADPDQRMPMWLKNDRAERIKMDNDFRSVGQEVLAPDVRERFERIAKDAEQRSMPDMAARAVAADRFWGPRIPDFTAGERSTASFSGLYRIAFRGGSQRVHVSALGLDRLLTPHPTTPNTVRVGRREQPPRQLNAFTLAPMIHAMGLFVAAECLPEWPPRPAIHQALTSLRSSGTGTWGQ